MSDTATGSRPLSRRSFALGFAAGVLALALVAVVGLLVITASAGDGAPGEQARPSPSPTSGPGPAVVPDGETWLGDVDLRSADVRTSDGPLRDVTATGAGVRLSEGGLTADRLELDATLPFVTAASQMGDGIELYAAGDLAGLRRTVEVLGRPLDIEATGAVRAEDGLLVIEPQTIELGSFEWLDSFASAAIRSLVTIRHQVTGLPSGMRLDTVEVAPEGFRVELSGSNVVIGS